MYNFILYKIYTGCALCDMWICHERNRIKTYTKCNRGLYVNLDNNVYVIATKIESFNVIWVFQDEIIKVVLDICHALPSTVQKEVHSYICFKILFTMYWIILNYSVLIITMNMDQR